MRRLENESFEDYKTRRKQNQIETKQKLRGKWFHRSKFILTPEYAFKMKEGIDFGFKNEGTYIKPIAKVKDSKTKELRNKKGYGDYLKNKYSC